MELIKKARTKMLQFYLQLLETEEELQKFTQLYETYRKLMHWTAEGILHDEHLAEDAVHEAFLRIIQNFHQIREIPCPKTRRKIRLSPPITVRIRARINLRMRPRTARRILLRTESCCDQIAPKPVSAGKAPASQFWQGLSGVSGQIS